MNKKHPSLPQNFFTENRKTLLNQLDFDSIVWLESSDLMLRNADMYHFWRQDSSFFYFTGIEQPGCSLLLVPKDDGDHEETLFIPQIDPVKETWEGKILTLEQAKEISGVSIILTKESFLSSFFRKQKYKDKLYCEINEVFPHQPLTRQHLQLQDFRVRLPGLSQHKISPFSNRLRLSKKPEEIKYLSKSIEIIRDAFLTIMKKVRPGMMEYELEAELAYTYLKQGCTRLGYDIILASGKNATILHYTKNSSQIKDSDLILVDSGGEYGMYSGDITRTFPANGKFNPRQKQCYAAVLEVQRKFLSQVKSGLTWKELFTMADELQTEIYTRENFIKKGEKHEKVALHKIGHNLGLDIHDVGDPKWKLPDGAVITVEPGLYLQNEGLGIRIEDNIVLDPKGYVNLSESIPKEIEEIEAIQNP